MNAAQILQELDEAFAACPVSLYTEPYHSKLADARLTVFRSPQHWVVIIEKIGYFIRMHGSVDCFTRFYALYGNCLERGWAESNDVLWEEMSELPFDPDTGAWLPTRQHFRYFWAGKWWDVYPTPQDLQQAGIDPELLDEVDREDYQQNPNTLLPVEWLRYLCHHLNHPFFASEARLREVVREALSDPNLEPQLQIVLQTREWEHPDYVADELPSDTESFQLIAEIIATGDASVWARADRSRFNSFWRYWIEKERAEEQALDGSAAGADDPLAFLMAQFVQATEAVGSDPVITVSARFQVLPEGALDYLMALPASVVLAEYGSEPFVRWLVRRYGGADARESFGEWLRRCASAGGRRR